MRDNLVGATQKGIRATRPPEGERGEKKRIGALYLESRSNGKMGPWNGSLEAELTSG
jgi:hypothetical protein